MWLKLHATISIDDSGKERIEPVLTNMDNVVHVVPRTDGGSAIFGVDGSMYPVRETRDQIDKAMAEFANGRKHA